MRMKLEEQIINKQREEQRMAHMMENQMADIMGYQGENSGNNFV